MLDMLLPLAEYGPSRGADIGWDMLKIVAVDLPRVVIFGALGVALLLIGFKVFDKMLPKLDFEVELGEKRNLPLAIVLAAFLLGIALVVVVVVM